MPGDYAEKRTSGASAEVSVAEAHPSEALNRHLSTIYVPLAFLGLGVYRAWIELAFVGTFIEFPSFGFSVRDVFDWSMVVTALGCTALARYITPFFNKRSVYIISGITLTISTFLLFCSSELPFDLIAVGLTASILGGFGIGLLILLWSELYACLNPLRVALYYSASIIVGALIIYIYMGFKLPWLFVMTALLPLVSLICARQGFGALPEAELPQTTYQRFSLPWKAILFMAAYAFGYGLMETSGLYENYFGPHSAPGVLVVGILVFVGVAVRGGRFDFGLIYRVALPLAVLALFLVAVFGRSQTMLENFCMSAAYTAQSILIMLIWANICYRYGVSAVWLFGIERGVRQILMWLGRVTAAAVGSPDILAGYGETLVSLLAIIAVIVATMVLFNEKDLSSRWGANFIEGGTDTAAVLRKQELEERCKEVAQQYKLSAREEEVLQLLAERKTVGIIERELVIANGTAKAHVRHIYQKLDIHTRQELFDLLGIDNREPITRQTGSDD